MNAERDVVVPNEQGLHARPIAMMAQTATKFRSAVTVAVEGREVDGRSVLQLMTLCAARGTKLVLRARGDDAEALVQALAALVESGFGET